MQLLKDTNISEFYFLICLKSKQRGKPSDFLHYNCKYLYNFFSNNIDFFFNKKNLESMTSVLVNYLA